MYRTLINCGLVSALAISSVASASTAGDVAPTSLRRALSAFVSEDELASVFRRWADEARRRRDEQRADQTAASASTKAAALPAGRRRRSPRKPGRPASSRSPTFSMPVWTRAASSNCTANIWSSCGAGACSSSGSATTSCDRCRRSMPGARTLICAARGTTKC